MHRVWTKIVVAGLAILGEGVFASEVNLRSGDSYETNGNAVQLSQPAILDDAGLIWNPLIADINTIQPEINLTHQSFAAVFAPALDLLKHHSFNPRAPPVPAI